MVLRAIDGCSGSHSYGKQKSEKGSGNVKVSWSESLMVILRSCKGRLIFAGEPTCRKRGLKPPG